MIIIIYFKINLMIFFVIMSMYFLMNKILMLMEFEFLKFLSIKIEYIILFDWINLLFMSLVLMISLSVIIYSIEYMSGDLNIERYFYLI